MIKEELPNNEKTESIILLSIKWKTKKVFPTHINFHLILDLREDELLLNQENDCFFGFCSQVNALLYLRVPNF